MEQIETPEVPVESPAPPVEARNTAEDFIFTDIEDVAPEEPAPEVPKPETQPVSARPDEAPKPQAEPRPQETQPPPVVQAQPAVPAPSPAPAPQATAPARPSVGPRLSPEEIQREYEKREREVLGALEQAYASQITDEEAEQFLTNPRQTLAKLAAKVNLDVYKGVHQVLASQLPATIPQYIAATRQEQEYEHKFFNRWPELNKPEYRSTIQKAATLYMQLNPQAPIDEAIEHVGLVSALQLKIPAQQAPQPQPAAPLRPHTPVAATAAPSGAPPPKREPGPYDFFMRDDE